jgi:hypothetical protein
MSEPERAPSVGATGGLPGANAAPAASEPTTDELADTLSTGDTATTPVDPGTGLDVDQVVDAEADLAATRERASRERASAGGEGSEER